MSTGLRTYSCHIQTYNSVITLYATCLRYFSLGLLYSIIPLFTMMIFLYTAREIYVSKSSMISSIMVPIILSEILLFAGFFWGVYQYIFSISLVTKDTIIYPSSRVIIIIITLLLAACSIITGTGHSCREKSLIGLYNNIVTTTLGVGLLFVILQCNEYITLDGFINDTISYSTIYIITGLHFYHVIIGIVLLLISFCVAPYNYKDNTQWLYMSFNSVWVVTAQIDYFCLLYWHFIEVLWLGIQFTFYSY